MTTDFTIYTKITAPDCTSLGWAIGDATGERAAKTRYCGGATGIRAVIVDTSKVSPETAASFTPKSIDRIEGLYLGAEKMVSELDRHLPTGSIISLRGSWAPWELGSSWMPGYGERPIEERRFLEEALSSSHLADFFPVGAADRETRIMGIIPEYIKASSLKLEEIK